MCTQVYNREKPHLIINNSVKMKFYIMYIFLYFYILLYRVFGKKNSRYIHFKEIFVEYTISAISKNAFIIIGCNLILKFSSHYILYKKYYTILFFYTIQYFHFYKCLIIFVIIINPYDI